MATSLTRSLILLLALVCGSSCTSMVCDKAVETAVDPADYAAAHAGFVSAWDELVIAIASTPAWHLHDEASLRVRGQANLAKSRLEALRPFAAHDLIPCSAIDLGVRHIDVIAEPADEVAPLRGARRIVDGERQLDAAMAERSYIRVRRRIDALECYAESELREPWLETTVMPSLHSDLQVVRNLDEETVALFTKYRSRDSAMTLAARANHVLELLDGHGEPPRD